MHITIGNGVTVDGPSAPAAEPTAKVTYRGVEVPSHLHAAALGQAGHPTSDLPHPGASAVPSEQQTEYRGWKAGVAAAQARIREVRTRGL